jgi:glutamate-1-semialdehyde 2,1-aminomutase
MAVFGKALGNGHPITAVIGTSLAMAAAHNSFISSTYWTESVGPVAALAVLEKMRRYDIPEHIRRIGNLLREGLNSLARAHRIGVTVVGLPPLTSISFDGADSAALMTLFTVRMLEHNILCGISFYPSFAHTDGHVARYLESADRVIPELVEAQRNGELVSRLNKKC